MPNVESRLPLLMSIRSSSRPSARAAFVGKGAWHPCVKNAMYAMRVASSPDDLISGFSGQLSAALNGDGMIGVHIRR